MAHMKKVRLFLIDIDLCYLERTAEYLSATRDVEVVGYVADAAQALPQIARTRPDCIVLSLAQRSCYALTLLRTLRAISTQQALIVCTSFLSEAALRLSRDVGADMFLSKPVPLEHLHECVVGTTRVKRRMLEEQRALEAGEGAPSPTARIRQTLMREGIVPRLFGFACLAEALYRLSENERLLRNMRRNLYPQIAQALSTTPESVERNIRTAIRRARSADGDGAAALSNRQFLARALQRLREESEGHGVLSA